MLSKNNLALLEAVKLGYKFDNDNNIISACGFIRKLIYHNGYPQFTIRFNKKPYYVAVHKFKAYLLYGDAMFEPGIQVRHKMRINLIGGIQIYY